MYYNVDSVFSIEAMSIGCENLINSLLSPHQRSCEGI